MQNQRRGRGNRRPVVPKRQQNLVTRRYLRNQERGTRISVRPDPPSIVFRPYTNLVLRLTGHGTKKVTDATISDAILKQLALKTIDNVNLVTFKMQEVRAWCEVTVTHPLKAPFQIDFRSLMGEGFTNVQVDVGTTINYHRLGYRWPVADQTITLSGNPQDDTIMVVKPTDLNAQWVIDCHLTWSVTDFTTILSNIETLQIGDDAPLPSPAESFTLLSSN